MIKKKGKAYTKSTQSFAIGDYVTRRHNSIHEIACIEDASRLRLSDIPHDLPVEKVCPILLAREWFETLNTGCITSYHKQNAEDNYYIVHINSEKIKGEFYLRYVHELQHILRYIEG